LLVNLHTHVVLHHFSFKGPVTALKFSPDGTLFAAGVGKLLQIWRTPGFRKEFAPFQLISTLAGCHDSITCLGWSSDSRWIVAGSKDLSTKLFSVYRAPDQHAVTLSGHRDVLVGVFFAKPLVSAHDVGLYTLSRDGALFDWRYFPNADLLQADENKDHTRGGRKRRMQTEKDDMDLDDQKQHKDGEQMQKEEEDMGAGRWQKTETNLITGHWRQSKKNFFMQSAKLASCDYHMGLGLLVAGFSSGVFGLYQLPDFTCIHMLSISTERITTSVFNSTGNLLAFGCANLGQLLVWEWRTETQILKQQGHFFDVNCVAFSPDSQYLASGADDNKLKVYSLHKHCLCAGL
jgi:periodic tryptophan protein 2